MRRLAEQGERMANTIIMGFSSRRRDAGLSDAEGAAAAATNQLDTESRDERVGRPLVSMTCKNLAPHMPMVGRGMWRERCCCIEPEAHACSVLLQRVRTCT